MPLRHRLQQIVLILLLLASLYSSIQYFVVTFGAGKIDFDHVANFEARYDPVKENLPIQRGTLGYLADWDVPSANYDPSDQDAEYILTQYSFSPFILLRGTDQEWIVGNLDPQAYELWTKDHIGEYQVRKFKGNIYLIHRLDIKK